MSKLVKAPGLGYIRGITNGEEVKLNKKHLANKENVESKRQTSNDNKNIASAGCLQLNSTNSSFLPGQGLLTIIPYRMIF